MTLLILDNLSGLGALGVNALAAVLIALGIALMWRGLRGGGRGERGLLRTRTGFLGRIEGFRLTVFGLVLLGLGLAAIWRAEWLFWLAIGIGFVEILESSALIAVWKRGRGRDTAARTP